MNIKLTFLGGAGNVAGSRYLLEANDTQLLVDCGLFQERQFASRNWDPFPVPPKDINAVLLTHAHVDHAGLLPKLVKDGFYGKIYCTTATSEIAQIVLHDAAHIQEEDAAYKKKRHQREKRKGPYPEIPLYTAEDAKATAPLFAPVNYMEPVQIGDGIVAEFCDAGHVLGSSMVKLTVTQGGEHRILVFSGDVGRWDRPMLSDPSIFSEVDYILVESTYGDRIHWEEPDLCNALAEIVNTTWQAGGNIIIPSFALQRAQELLYHLNNLVNEKRIPPLMVFLDSPMAIKITEVYKRYYDLLNKELMDQIHPDESPFDFPGLKMVESVKESKAINQIKGTVIIIAGAGMVTGGRIKHHLVTNISRPESTILFVGYQAVGTLGRLIVDGAKEVRIHGQQFPVRAKIIQLRGFSAHADRNDLVKWLSALQKPPRQIFVVHGEPESARAFADYLRKYKNWNVTVPGYGDEVALD